jgi:hypothetical protein
MARTMPVAPAASRDLRLDLVRGLTMLIIFVAHVPNNLWADYIPARMGFSSGAEIFVLCSGIASGLAFGGAFIRKGYAEGCRRIVRRIAQLYGAHLGLIVLLGGLALAWDSASGSTLLTTRYDLHGFVAAPLSTALAYAALAYVPAFFDILPLYIVLLAMVPFAMLLAGRPKLLLALSASLWAGVLLTRIGLPNLATGGVWYFNPFAWQFLFLLGFGWARGWWPVPRAGQPWLLAVSAAYVLAAIPLNFWAINDGTWPVLMDVQHAIYPGDAITVLHPTRLLHVLALGYLVISALEPVRHHLNHAVLGPVIAVGQNSFATFLVGLGLSMLGGIVIDHAGQGAQIATLVNIVGILALLVVGTALNRRAIHLSQRTRLDPAVA